MSIFDVRILGSLAVLACVAIATWIYVQREYEKYLNIGRA